MRATERLRHAVYSLYYAARSLNYASADGYGYPRKKTVGGVSFRSYEPYNLHGNDYLLHELLGRTDADDVFYDVGTNVGVYSCAAAAAGADVHGFEPNPDAREKAHKNFDANGFGCVLHPFALCDADGASTFHVSSYPEVSSLRREKATVSGGRVVRTFEAETRRLDTAVEDLGLPRPDHLKVDVEGAGVEVLCGAGEVLADARPTVYFEPHGNAEEAREVLEEKGYSIEETGDRDKDGGGEGDEGGGSFVAEPT